MGNARKVFYSTVTDEIFLKKPRVSRLYIMIQTNISRECADVFQKKKKKKKKKNLKKKLKIFKKKKKKKKKKKENVQLMDGPSFWMFK